MQVSPPDVTTGMQAGLLRGQARFGPGAGPTSGQFVRNQVTRAFEDWPEQLSPQFVQLISELVMVASVARSWNKEPQLKDEEIYAFIANSASFFNSFKHK